MRPKPPSRPSSRPNTRPKSNPNSRPSSNSNERPSFNDRPTSRPSSNANDRPTSRPNSNDRPTSRPSSNANDRPTFRPKSNSSARPTSRPTSKYGTASPKPKIAPEQKSTFLSERPVFQPTIKEKGVSDTTDMRLNKYVAQCSIAARRKAGEIILAGEVKVNGEVVKEPGYRVKKGDVIVYKGKPIKPEEDQVYILMNKPKDTITTASDERGRKTVLDIVNRTVKTRVFPVGRLDRDTTGLLLLTNDGDLAQKMAHPSYKIKKVYHVVLNRNISMPDFEEILKGVTLEDGVAEVDNLQFVPDEGKNELYIEIHIGKNRIIRRIFEHLRYEVERLDRMYYGGLSKKNLPRGTYRSLTEREVINLKHLTGQ